MLNHVFMYGTLKPGGRAFHLIEKDVENPREGSIPGRLFSLGRFPALRQYEEDMDFEVFGVLLDVKPDVDFDRLITRLDRYESVPNLYTRKTDKVLVGGRTYDATYYVGRDPLLFVGDIVADGRWPI